MGRFWTVLCALFALTILIADTGDRVVYEINNAAGPDYATPTARVVFFYLSVFVMLGIGIASSIRQGGR